MSEQPIYKSMKMERITDKITHVLFDGLHIGVIKMSKAPTGVSVYTAMTTGPKTPASEFLGKHVFSNIVDAAYAVAMDYKDAQKVSN